MKQFILNYIGTKYRETKELKEIDFSKYDTIVELFGGSFGFIRYLFYELGIKDKKFIVYDFDAELIDFYNHFKNLENRQTFIDKYNSISKDIFTKYKTGKDNSNINLKPTIQYLDNLDENKYVIWLIKKNITGCAISRIYLKNNLDNTIFDHVSFIHKPIQDINFNEFTSSTLIYLDPPYLFECNTYYNQHNDFNNNKSFFRPIINLFMEHNISVIFIHSCNEILDYIFGKWIYKTYPKTYGARSRKVDHVAYFKY